MYLGNLALAAAAAFLGAALYSVLVEQPARSALDDRAALAEWKPSDSRGSALLTLLAVASAFFAVMAFWTAGDPTWLLGTGFILASLPYTYFVVVPLNNSLLSLSSGASNAGARGLIQAWNLLEWGQVGLGALAVLCFIIART